LEIKKQKVTALLGHNGAGKTTLFKCILGLIKPQSGFIEIDSNRKGGELLATNISYMPDSGGFYPLLSPFDNLLFRASFYYKQIEAKQSAAIWLEKLKINKLNVKLAGQLSHGLQKRLSLACALINNPNIILLDEPTNGLDPESIDLIIKIIGELEKEDTTILINTHDLNLVRELCYKIIFLQDGTVIGENIVKEIEKNIKEYYLKMVEGYKSGVNNA
jgi:ABC-type multidrug transport system ATPase subunit